MEIVTGICSFLQIIGLFLIILQGNQKRPSRSVCVFIILCGLAPIIRIFLPIPVNQNIFAYGAAASGVGIIVIEYVRFKAI